MTDDPYKIAFLIYPGMTQLDFTGPAQVLHRMPGAEVSYVWKSLNPVMSDCEIAILPTALLSRPTLYNMICVPGGFGCTDLMADAEVLTWLRRQSEQADLVTSVCTGSLILAAAGLLDGYQAGCHWAWADQLELFGAKPVRKRVVTDRNRITAGGVTAGIDFAFQIIETRCGKDIADRLRLGLEYDPDAKPGGIPETARPEILASVTSSLESKMSAPRDAIYKIAKEKPELT